MPLLPGDVGKYREGQITSDLAGGETYWVVRLSQDQLGHRWWLGDRFSEAGPAETDVARFATEAEARVVERQQREAHGGVEALPVFGLRALARIADWADDATDAVRSFGAIANSGGSRELHLVGSPLGGGHVVRFRDTPGRIVVDVLRPVMQ